jgi:hypothetical protein
LQPDQGGVQDLELILEICLDVQLLDDVREFQAVAIAKILVDERSMAIGAYDVEHVQACFDSCPVTSYSMLELGWQES